MSDILTRLRDALAPTYRLEHELGGGGMSRVFVAEETALGRRVVIKVLPPEYAAVLSTDRFRREIQVAARLQHPHIVPVLAAGQVPGEGGSPPLLYYTMPFVEGESLRTRLRRGPMPVGEAVRLLREVADALEYAHGQGLVHRDIKPDNVLLTGRHAMVTDFGIAKALGAATAGGAMTTAGLAVGTPAYMAPEQIAADPHVDHRADLYALGLLGYEMLTGAGPFDGRTPQAILAAHLTEVPASLAVRRPDIPRELADILTRCLAKRPEDRPQSAAAVAAGLGDGDSAAPSPQAAKTQRRLRLVLAGLVLALAAATIARSWPARSLVAEGRLSAREPLLVSEFASPGDSTLGAAITEAFRVDMSQSPAFRLVTGDQVRGALTRMQQSPDTRLTTEVAREVAQRLGVKAFLTGSVEPLGGRIIVSARLISADSGAVLAAFRETAADSADIVGALDRVSKQLRRRIGESLHSVRQSPPLAQVTTGSLAALRRYSEALQALNTEGKRDRGRQLLQEAVSLDSGFAMAWRKLGIDYRNSGDRAEASRALTRAFNHRDRLTEIERYQAEGTYYFGVKGDLERSAASYTALLQLDSTNMVALNNLGVIAEARRDYAGAERYARMALRNDPTAALVFFNILESQINQGHLAEADRTLAEGRQRFPQHRQLAWEAAGLAQARQDYDSAASLLKSVADDATRPESERAAATGGLADLSLLHGGLDEASTLRHKAMETAARLGEHRRYLQAAIAEALATLLTGASDSADLRLVDDALNRFPLASMDTLDRPYLDLAYLFAVAGRPARARTYLNEYERIDSTLRRPLEGFRHGVRGVIALAEGRGSEALSELRFGVETDNCPICGLPDLARAYGRMNQSDSVIAAYERFVSTPAYDRREIDGFFLARAYRRLGELYEEKGDRQKATAYYQRFLDLWRDADPELQPQVREAKRRLAALVSQ